MTKQDYLIIKLAEEAVEVAQRCTKILTFGLLERQSEGPSARPDPERSMTNVERLFKEMCDLVAVWEMLSGEIKQTSGVVFTGWALNTSEKKKKMEKYMEYSRTLGRLE